MPTDDRGDTIHRKEYSDQRTELIERIAKLEGSLNAERESRIGLQRTMEAMFRSEEAARSKTEVLITEKFEQQNQWQRRFDSQSSRMVSDTMMEDKLVVRDARLTALEKTRNYDKGYDTGRGVTIGATISLILSILTLIILILFK